MPPSSRHRTLYCAPPSGILRTSLDSRCWRNATACGPQVSISPMWLTSKTPACVRTASCSARMPPAYWTGISQPANGTSRAPAAACRACRAVRRSSLAGALIRAKPNGSGRSPALRRATEPESVGGRWGAEPEEGFAMRAGSHRRRAMLGASLAALATALPAVPAAATTIGATSATGSGCSLSGQAGKGFVLFDPTFSVPAGGGQVTSFTRPDDAGSDGIMLDYKVLRPVGDGGYVTVGSTGPQPVPLPGPGFSTFDASPPILAAAGDVIGFFFPATGAGS